MDLASCPFCGETKHFEVFAVFSSSQPDGLRIECGNCGGQGPTGEDKDQAIANWNRRPASTLIIDKASMLTIDGPPIIGHNARITWPPGELPPIGTTVLKDDGKGKWFASPGEIPPVMIGGTDDLAAARERRDQAGLPSVTATADLGEVSMDFDLGGDKPKR